MIPISKSKVIHVHHWILGAFGLLVIFQGGTLNSILGGFCLGLVLHGLRYEDAFEVIKNQEYT